jgi:hypothetical protein
MNATLELTTVPTSSPRTDEAPTARHPRLGERQSRRWIDYGRPDVTGAQFRHYKRTRVAVIGAERDVAPLLTDLELLARQKPGTVVTHVSPERPRAHAAPAAARIDGFRVHGFYPTDAGVMLEGDDGRWIGPFDRLIVRDLPGAV